MRLRPDPRSGIYYVFFPGEKKRSLRTKDKATAKRLYREIEREYLRGNIINLDLNAGTTLSEFKKFYVNDPERADLSISTHRNDELSLRLFIEFIGDRPLDYIGNDHIVKFKQACINKGNKPVTVNTYLTRIQAALNYAAENGFIKTVPKIKKFKLAKRLPRFILPEDVEKLLAEADKSKPEMARIIRFALFTGTRRGEIIKCRYEHIKDGCIKVVGKGNKERLIPLVSYAKNVLAFQDFGKIFSYDHTSTLSNYFRGIARSAGIKARFHDLRHTAATHMLSKGIPLEVVQKIMGHEDIRTTQIYGEVLPEVLKKQMRKLEL